MKKDTKVKIFTMTHKKFMEPEEPIYVPLQVGRAVSNDLGYLGDDTGDSISEKNCYYGELTGVYWVWKNVMDADIIGICHYRRFFLDQDRKIMNQKQYNEILNKYDVMVSNRVEADKSYIEYYGEAHNAKDLLMVGEVIKEKYPDYYQYYEQAIQGNVYYYGNLMVTSRGIFQKYAKWLFDILFEVEKRIDISEYDLYNQRVFGFLSEQMLKIWLDKNRLHVYEGTIGITAEKAETVELKLAMSQLVRMGKIEDARNMFYEYLKIRPDVRLELSDIKQEIPMIEQLLYIAQEEKKHGIAGLQAYSDNLQLWIEHYRKVLHCLVECSKGCLSKKNVEYLLQKNVTWIMVKVILLNVPENIIKDSLQVAQIVQMLYEENGRKKDAENLK